MQTISGWFLVPLIFVWLLLSSVASAEQWMVTTKYISVADTKTDGKYWDADLSAPDVYGWIILGEKNPQGKCIPVFQQNIELHQNQFSFHVNRSMVFDRSENKAPCLWIKLFDKDLAADDLIGEIAKVINLGEMKLKVGQAEVAIFVNYAHEEQFDVPSLPEPQAPREKNLYRVRVVSAEIQPRRKDGSAWDAAFDLEAQQAEADKKLLNLSLTLITIGAPMIAPITGAVLSKTKNNENPTQTHKAETVSAPDPKVIIRWGDKTIETPAIRNTYSPRWETEFLISEKDATNGNIRLDVLDQDDEGAEPIGTQLVPNEEFFSKNLLRLNFGSVEQLLIEINPVAEQSEPLSKSIKLIPPQSWHKTGINIIGGQLVQVTAMGMFCLQDGTCFGPKGNTKSSPSRISEKGPDIMPGQLCAVVGDQLYAIGDGALFESKTNGELILGLATKSISSGSVDASVKLLYPFQVIERSSK